MSYKKQEAYKVLAEALSELEDGPQCADPLVVPFFYPEPMLGQQSPRAMHLQLHADEVNAKMICRVCPVKALCAQYAIIAEEPAGIWGGTTPAERKAISSPEPSVQHLL